MAEERLNIAVIGSGIGGLTAAYLLSAKHNVCVYEAADNLGMDQHGITLDSRYADGTFEANNDPRHHTIRDLLPKNASTDGGKCVRVDVPLRVFTESYYPHLTGLYDHVGVEYQAEDYSSSFTTQSGETLYTYKNFLLGPLSLPLPLLTYSIKTLQSKAQHLVHTPYYKIFKDVLRFVTELPSHIYTKYIPSTSKLTYIEYLLQEKYTPEFIYYFALPSFAAIATCSLYSAGQYPAYIVLQYLTTRAWQGVRRARGGAEAVVHRLVQRCTHIYLCTKVTKLDYTTHPGKIHVISSSTTTSTSDDNNTQTQEQPQTDVHSPLKHVYDRVVFATQANQTSNILQNSIFDTSNTSSTSSNTNTRQAWDAFVSGLQTIRYEPSRLVLHTDPSLMPVQRRDWRSVNFILPDLPTCTKQSHTDPRHCATSNKEELAMIESQGMATIWMNRVQHGMSPDIDVFQSWNPLHLPKNEQDILGISYFERPVVTHASLHALHDVWKHQGVHNVYVVGSFSLPAVPLLESAAKSAVMVAGMLGCECTWANEHITQKVQVAEGLQHNFKQRCISMCISPIAALLVALLPTSKTQFYTQCVLALGVCTMAAMYVAKA